MTAEAEQPEYLYSVIAFLTPKQMENFLQSDFKRLTEKAGVKGARIHVERAMIADYEKVIHDVTALLHSARPKAA